MRKMIIGVAAMLAVAAPGAALAQTGYVDAAYTNSSVEVGPFDADGDGYRVGGAVAFDAHALGVQLDADVGAIEADGGGDADFWNVGGHVYTRNAAYLIGGFANYGNVDAGGGGDDDYWTVGVEGQYYLARTTLNGAVSYSEADDSDLEVTGIDLGARHFITDNFAIDGGVGFANAEAGGGDADVVALNLGAEYQFDAYPISVFGGYQRAEVDDFDVESDALTIGVRYNFGGTLFDRDRSGASLGRGAGAGRLLGLL